MRVKTVLLTASGGAVAVALGLQLRPQLNVEQLRAQLARDLPAGTQSIRVSSYLDSLHIRHSDLLPSGTSGEARWLLQGGVEDLRRPHLLADGIYLQFRFNDRFELLTQDVDESWTMP